MHTKYTAFEFMLLAVGLSVSIIGFRMINQNFISDGYKVSWPMLISMFVWMNLLVMLILAGLMVDLTKGKKRK